MANPIVSAIRPDNSNLNPNPSTPFRMVHFKPRNDNCGTMAIKMCLGTLA